MERRDLNAGPVSSSRKEAKIYARNSLPMSRVSPSGRDGTFAIADAVQVPPRHFFRIAAGYVLTRARLNSLNLLGNLLTVTDLETRSLLFNPPTVFLSRALRPLPRYSCAVTDAFLNTLS